MAVDIVEAAFSGGIEDVAEDALKETIQGAISAAASVASGAVTHAVAAQQLSQAALASHNRLMNTYVAALASLAYFSR